MLELDKFFRTVSNFSKFADFVIIYTSEAHPQDGWGIRENEIKLHQHKSLEDRLEAAKILLDKKPNCPVLVDTMSNEACKLYGSLPERLYIILDGIVVMHGGEGPFKYYVEEVEEWLTKFTGKE